MLNILRILLFSLTIISYALPQNFQINGQITDSLSGEYLSGANIVLTSVRDGALKGTSSGNKGVFKIENLQRGRYSLKITFIGYKPYETSFPLRGSVDFGTIKLSPSSVETDEVEVVGKIPPVVQNADTTEFNSGAYKVNKDANAEDLVTKMPGVMVQDGKVQVQGEDVKRVLVDGREFFGDDPSAVLKNLPAEVIEKIQVFDQQGEQQRFTGFDDGNTSKTINIVTRMRNREGLFGKLSGGYGSEKKYLTGGNVNIFKGDTRLTLLGQLNNINEQNFSSEDLLGVMQGGSSGGRRGSFRRPSGLGGGRGGGFNIRGGGTSDFLVDSKDGLTTTKSFGVNYADKFGESLEITGSYFFNNTNNEAFSTVNRDYLLSGLENQKYFEESSSYSKNFNHRFNMRMEYEIDTLNSFMFNPRITMQKNDGSSGLSGFTSDSALINSVSNNFNSELDAINASAQFLYRRRFSDRGRTASLNLTPTYKKNSGDNFLYSENLYYGSGVLSDTIDQTGALLTDGSGISGNLVFTEPLGENGMLMFNSALSFNTEESDKRNYNNLSAGASRLDTSLSSVYSKKYYTRNFGAGYRYRYEEFSMMFSLTYNIAQLNNNRSFPYTAEVKRTFYSLLPSFMIRYEAARETEMRLYYRADNNDPSVEQLQDVLDNSNPLQLSIGNPSLKQDYRHSLNIRVSKVNPGNLSSLFFLVSGTFTDDYIGTKTIAPNKDTVYQGIAINRGSQLRIPENLDGYFSLRTFFSYGLPVEFIKSNFNINLSVNYSSTPAVVNDINYKSKNITYSAGLVISSNISENVDFTISSRSSYTDRFNEQTTAASSYFNQNTGVKFYVKLPLSIVIQTNFAHNFEGSLPDDYDPNSYLWNLSLGKKLFDDAAELRLTAVDILNKTTSIRRTTNETYIEDVSSNVLGRYYMLSFIYNLRSF